MPARREFRNAAIRDDRIFLRLAYAARVEALVTGDNDLLGLAGKSRIPILAPDALKTEMQM